LGLTHRIIRLPSQQIAAGPTIGVAELSSGKSPQERAGHVLAPDRIPAHQALVLLWRGSELSSPDTIAVKRADRAGTRIEIQIESRRFDGTVHANIVTRPVVEVELGPLEPERYEVSIEITKLSFSEYDHPEKAANPRPEHASFSFTVL
jgi:hypothetical protein